MPLSIWTPLIAFLTAAGMSYAIVRPIGSVRHYVGAFLASLLLGVAGTAIDAIIYESIFRYAIAVPIIVALFGSCLGVAIAHYRRTRLLTRSSSKPQHAHNKREARSMWHDHAFRRS
jgi:hypothetical protein